MESIEEKIAAVAAKQKADNWANRQEAARQQQADSERQRVERYRSQRIAQIKAALDGMPARRKHAEIAAADSEELAGIWTKQVDWQANAYAQRIHGERQSGRPARLELGSEEAQAYFFGSQIKKSLLQLAATATQRSFGAPLIDAESFAAELRNEEKKLKAELAELQLRG
jgi:hypothetical protein